MIVIKGVTHEGGYAEVSVRCAWDVAKRRVVWQQRRLTRGAAHLQRDYVCEERFEEIERTWLPCDWRRYIVLTAA